MIKPRAKVVFALFFLFIATYAVNVAVAQDEIGPGESDINVNVVPVNPGPYQDVTINLTSYATDLNKAMVTWQSGKNTVLSGYGKTSYSFKTLGPNTNLVLSVTILVPGQTDKITKEITINPSEVELIWEGVDSYTPAFYRGKSFPTSGGLIKVVALPNTSSIKTGKGSISYSWRSDDDAVLSASGYNKDTYVFRNSELKDKENISAIAESVDGEYSAAGSTQILIAKPKILFYKKSPTEGVIYSETIADNTFISEDEVTIVAVPYFLALKGNEDKFKYSWKINGSSIATPFKKTEVTVHPASRGGYATIEVIIENLSTLYQKVSGGLRINL